MAFQFTDDNFEQEVLQTDKVVLVDFWATWCGPCIALAPTIDLLSSEFEGIAVVGKIDIDNNPQVATAFGIRSIPTLLIFKNGQLVDKQIGLANADILRTKINAQLAS